MVPIRGAAAEIRGRCAALGFCAGCVVHVYCPYHSRLKCQLLEITLVIYSDLKPLVLGMRGCPSIISGKSIWLEIGINI